MPFASIGGTKARYEVRGDGPLPLMLAPAAFDASMSRWRLNGARHSLRIAAPDSVRILSCYPSLQRNICQRQRTGRLLVSCIIRQRMLFDE
jgi:hypothetical protein